MYVYNCFYGSVNRVKKDGKTDWLNSPNAYKREEIEEKGSGPVVASDRWIPAKMREEYTKGEGRNQGVLNGSGRKGGRGRLPLI